MVFAASALVLALFAAVCGGGARATTTANATFSREQGAHAAYRDEWWRCIGHLHSRDGRRFDFAATFFRFAVGAGARGRPIVHGRAAAHVWETQTIYAATLAIVDERAGHFESTDRFARDAFGLGSARVDRLGLRVVDWTLDGTTASESPYEKLTLRAGDASTGLELFADESKAPVALATHEYAMTSWRANGFVNVGGDRVAVSGKAWFDHRYGADELAFGWDRFALQLDDGRDIWIEVERRRPGSKPAATRAILIERDGSAHELSSHSYSFGSHNPSGWQSRATGARYPNVWALTIPSARLILSLEPVVANQEIVARTRGVSYWNGAVDVYDITPGTPGKRLGAGYAELTGYDRPLRL